MSAARVVDVVIIMRAKSDLTRRATKGENNKKENKNPIQDFQQFRRQTQLEKHPLTAVLGRMMILPRQ